MQLELAAALRVCLLSVGSCQVFRLRLLTRNLQPEDSDVCLAEVSFENMEREKRIYFESGVKTNSLRVKGSQNSMGEQSAFFVAGASQVTVK